MMTAVEIFANHRQMLRDELALFVKYYNGDQPEVIASLASKIEWVCVEKGSPSSIIPMLKSIISGKIKIWADYNDSYDIEKGQQMNPRMNRAHLERVLGKDGYLKGHFRFNSTAWMANYATRNYIEDFYIKKNFQKLKEESEKTLDLTKMRVSIKFARVWKNSETQYIVDVTSHKNNDYRFFYSSDTGMVLTNCGTNPINEVEEKWVLKMVTSEYPEIKQK